MLTIHGREREGSPEALSPEVIARAAVELVKDVELFGHPAWWEEGRQEGRYAEPVDGRAVTHRT